MPFFTYQQRPYFGPFDRSLPRTLIIEAENRAVAHLEAQSLRVRFDQWTTPSVVGDVEPTVGDEVVVDAEGFIACDTSVAPLWIVYADGHKETCGSWDWGQ